MFKSGFFSRWPFFVVVLNTQMLKKKLRSSIRIIQNDAMKPTVESRFGRELQDLNYFEVGFFFLSCSFNSLSTWRHRHKNFLEIYQFNVILAPLLVLAYSILVQCIVYVTYSPPTYIGAGHKWTWSTNIGCNQWLSLAEASRKVVHASRNRSLVACTSMCGCANSLQVPRQVLKPCSTWSMHLKSFLLVVCRTKIMHRLLCFKSKLPNHFVFTLGHYLFLLFLVPFIWRGH